MSLEKIEVAIVSGFLLLLYARHTLDNIKSMNLMGRIGMKVEGALRNSYYFHNRQVDLVIWSIVRSDLDIG